VSTTVSQSSSGTITQAATGAISVGNSGTTFLQAGGTAPASADDIDVCDYTSAIFYILNVANVSGFGKVYDCTEPTEVFDVSDILWQKNSDGSYTDLNHKSFAGGNAPYTSPSISANCVKGLNVHNEFEFSISSESGVGSSGPINSSAWKCGSSTTGT
jgi:hypothetical protein